MISTKIIIASSGCVSGRLEKPEEADAVAAKRFASSFWLLLKNRNHFFFFLMFYVPLP
jgi:hypothetical protein